MLLLLLLLLLLYVIIEKKLVGERISVLDGVVVDGAVEGLLVREKRLLHLQVLD